VRLTRCRPSRMSMCQGRPRSPCRVPRVSPSSQMSVCHGCRSSHPSQASSTTLGLTLIILGLRFLVYLAPVTQEQGLPSRTEVWVHLQELEPLRMSVVIGTENPRMEREPSQGGDLSTARRTTTGVGCTKLPPPLVILAAQGAAQARPAQLLLGDGRDRWSSAEGSSSFGCRWTP